MTNPINQASGVAEPDDKRARFHAHFKYGFESEFHEKQAWETWRAALATQPAAPAEVVAPDTQAVWCAIADYVMAGEALQRRRAEGHLMNAEWIDAVESAVAAVDRAVLAALRTPAQAPSTGAVTRDNIMVGHRYNWKNQPERLFYMGLCEPRNGRWHQFAKVDAPAIVWCEVQDDDLSSFERSEPATILAAAPPVVQPASPAVEVASGFKLVPIEATPEMVEAICEMHTSGKWPEDFGTYAIAIRRRHAAAGYSAAVEAAPGAPGQEAAECAWKYDDDEYGTWSTSCGNLFSFTADGPEENDFKFCCYCGGKLAALPPSGAGEKTS